jgi:hypothetical protein
MHDRYTRYQKVHGPFSNGLGVSIVKGYGTYGSESGLYELAVLKNSNKEVTYATSITRDVIGYLTLAEAEAIAKQVEALPGLTIEEDLTEYIEHNVRRWDTEEFKERVVATVKTEEHKELVERLIAKFLAELVE